MKSQNNVNLSDKILAATFLKFLPKRITPNQITIFRFFTVPFIALLLLLEKYQLGIILFAVSSFTDALDGALARTKKMVTKWGSIYDPLADKILITTTAFLILPKYLSPWFVFIIIFLEMILIGIGYYHRVQHKDFLIRANWWGKSKMILQSIGISLVFIHVLWPIAGILIVAQLILYLAIILAIISLITYSL